jgi:hypothetical protein
MTDIWQRKGLDKYGAEAEKVSDQQLRDVLRKHANTADKVDQFIPEARKALVYCVIMADADRGATPLEVRASLEQVHMQASALFSLLANHLPPGASALLKEAAYTDGDADLAALARQDPFAWDARIADTKTSIEALGRWAKLALEGAKSPSKGRPSKGAPAASAARLARLYERLTGRRASRITKTDAGHAEHGEYGRFAREFIGLIGGKLSDDALKRGIAVKAKKPTQTQQNSPLDVDVHAGPHKTVEAQDDPEFRWISIHGGQTGVFDS